MKKITILIAFMAFMAVGVFGQSISDISSEPSWNGSYQIDMCLGGSFVITIDNSINGDTYNLTQAGSRALLQSIVGTGGTIEFDPVTPVTTGTTNYSVFNLSNGFDPQINFTAGVVPQPTAPAMTTSPSPGTVCAGTNISATVLSGDEGSGGVSTCADFYEYSTDGGSNWTAYTLNSDISTTGLSGTDIVQIKATRKDSDGRGCYDENIYSWTVNELPTINAGPDMVAPAGATTITMAGHSFTGATGADWSGGNGSWAGNVYTIAAADITAGSVVFTYTTNTAAPCDEVSDNVTVDFMDYVVNNTSLSGDLELLTATFPPTIPSVIVAEDYKINSQFTLDDVLPTGTTITIKRDGVVEVSGWSPTTVGPFWYTDLIPGATPADFDANYGGAVEEYEIIITSPGDNPLPFNTNVLIESIISKDNFVNNTVLADITLGIFIPDEVAPTVDLITPPDGAYVGGEKQFVFDFNDANDLSYLEMDIFRPGDDQSTKIQLTLPADNAAIQAAVTGGIGDAYGLVAASYDETEQAWSLTINTAYEDGGLPVWPDGNTKFYIEVADVAGNMYGDMDNDPTFVEYTFDNTAPIFEGETPPEGSVVLSETGTFIWTIDASDINLYELEVDHSMESTIPEFSVYASADNVYGTPEDEAQFIAAGVTVTYDESDQIWTIDFGTTISDMFVTNGGITFYIVLKDLAGNTWGSMSPTTPENTFAYTLSVVNIYNVDQDKYYTTIQNAIDDASTFVTETIEVGAGTYDEGLIYIDRSVNLHGPNFGISGNSSSRDQEAILCFPDGTTGWDAVIYIDEVAEVTIDGFTVSDEGGVEGEDLTGIISVGSNNVHVSNNIVDGFTYISVWLHGEPNPATTPFYGGLVANNYLINNHGPYHTIYIQGMGGSITGNTVENCAAALQVQPYGQTNGGIVQNNVFEGYVNGIYHNYANLGSGTWTYTNNSVSAVLPPSGSKSPDTKKIGNISNTRGIAIPKDIDGIYDLTKDAYDWIGIHVRTFGNEGTGAAPHVEFNTDNNVDGTIALSDAYWNDVIGLQFRNTGNLAVTNFYNNEILNVDYAIKVHDDVNNNSIVDLDNNTLSNYNYAILVEPDMDIDASTGNTYNGVASGSASLTDLYIIEDAIIHKMDDSNHGFVTVIDNNDYVTTNTLGIQQGIDVASAGWIVNVNDGTYAENVVVDKAVTIEGPQKDVDPRTAAALRTSGSSAEAIVDGSGSSSPVFEITVPGVVLNGLEITNGTGDLVSSPSTDPVKTGVIVKYCIVSNAGDEGIQLRNVDVGGVEYCYVYSTTGDGINLSSECTNSYIKYNQVTTSASSDAAIYLYGNGPDMLIDNNLVSGVTSDNGIMIGNKSGADDNKNSSFTNNAIVSNNIITGYAGSEVGIYVNTSRVEITNNTINNWESSGDAALYLRWDIKEIEVTGNDITGNENGIKVSSGVDAANASTFLINGNNLSANTTLGLKNSCGGTIDATCNWWGSDDPSVIATMISGPVTPSPFLVVDNVDGIEYSWDNSNKYSCDSEFPVVNISNDPDTYYPSINAAIADATSGDIIEVQVADFTEPGQVHVTKSVTIQGQGKAVTTVRSNYNTSTGGHGVPAAIWIYTDEGISLNLKDMTLDAAGIDTKYGVTFKGGGSVTNVGFNEFKHSGSQYFGIAVQVIDGNVDVTGCTFTSIGRIGVHYRNGVISGAAISGLYDNNTYTGKGDGDWLDYALDISGGVTVTVSNSTVTNNTGVALSDGSTSAGILATTYFPYGENLANNVTITDNTLTGNTSGVAVGYGTSDVSVVTINNNNIYDNISYGISSTDGPVVDAGENWWGDASGPGGSGPGTGNPVDAEIDFCPWLDGPFESSPSLNYLVNNLTSGQGYCTIQEAIDEASDSDEIYVDAGTYNVNVIVNKNITLTGAGSATTIIDGDDGGSQLGAIQLTPGRDGVTIRGFHVKGIDNLNPAIEKAAIYLQGAQSNITIENNIIEARGDAGLQGEWNAANDIVTINNNTFTGQTFIGDEPATGDQFTIWNVARQAINFGGGSGTTNTQNFTFTNNAITTIASGTTNGNTLVTLDLVGLNVITGNVFSGKSSAQALRVRGSGSYSINNNAFAGTYPLAIYRQPGGTTVDATKNWFGSDQYTSGFHNVYGPIVFVPYLLNAEINPADPAYAFGGILSEPANLTVTHTESSQNILVEFDVEDGDMELYPVPGVDPSAPDYLDQVEALYLALSAATEDDAITAAALALGDDVMTEYYYYNGVVKTYLSTAGGDPLVKVKYWQNYLVRNDNERYPNWPGFPDADPGEWRTSILQDYTYRTSTNPATTGGAVADGWLDPVLGRDLYVTVTLIQNGSVFNDTEIVSIPRGPVNVYNADPPSETTWVSSHMTINDAIGAATTLDDYIIVVDEGTYAEDIVVDKAVDLRGPNYGISPNGGTRVSEAILVPYTAAISSGEVIHVAASNVKINGFTIDGDNSSLTSGFTSTTSADIDAAEGIAVYEDNINNLEVENNIFQNLSYFGVTIFGASYSCPSTSGHLVNDNLVQDMGTYDPTSGIAKWGGGVLIYNDNYTRIVDNVMTNVRIGIQTGNFHDANPGDAQYQVIDNNTIETRRLGIFYNLHTGGAVVPLTLSNNTITAIENVNESGWKGILMSSLSNVSGIANVNTIDGSGTTLPSIGIEVWNVKSDAPALISGGSVSNVDIGVFLNNFEGYNSDATNGAYASLSGITITPNISGIGIKTLDSPSSTAHANVQLSLGAGVAVAGGTDGVVVEGQNASLLATSDLALSGQTGNYFTLTDNSNDIDATTVTFEGDLGSEMLLADLFATEDMIIHKIDDENLGFVKVNDLNTYVTVNSFFAPETNPSIQRGINAASAGWIVNVDAGTYTENLIVDKGLTLLGLNSGTTSPSPSGSTIAGTSGAAISVQADDVEINGFTITNPDGSYAVVMDGYDNLEIRNNVITSIGNNMTSGNTHALTVTSNGGEVNTVIIEDNIFSDIHGGENDPAISNGSASAIAIGWTSSNNDVNGLLIQRNNISYVYAETDPWLSGNLGGKGAYGILLSVGASGSGQIVDADILENEISYLDGNWAHGIGLEGDTPGAEVYYNDISYLTDYKDPSDAVAVLVEDNASAGSVFINYNSFTNTNVGVWNKEATTVNATCNWWDTEISQDVADMVNGDVQFLPFLILDPTNGITYPWSGTDKYSCDGEGPVLNITQGTSYMTIQAAVADANPANSNPGGDQIEVDPGTYTEVGQIIIDKNLTISGTGIGSTTIKPNANTGSSVDARGWWLVNAGIEFNLSEMTLDGDGFNVYQGIRQKGFGSIDQVHFTNIKHPGYAGVAIAAFGNGNVDVTNSNFDEIGRVGVLYYGTGISGSNFTGNTYTGKGPGDWLDYCLDISAGAVVTADNNVVTGNRGVASTDGSTSGAFMATTYFGPGTTATITENTLTDNSTAVLVGFDEYDASTVTVTNNDLSGNDYGVSSKVQLVDAEYNWWGYATGPLNTVLNPCGEGSAVSENVDFSPWYYEVGMSLTSLNGLPEVTLSDIPNIDAIVDVPVVITSTIDYPTGLSNYNSDVLVDAKIVSNNTFPSGATVISVTYNGTEVLANDYSLATKNVVYLSEILGTTATPANGHEGLSIEWGITIAGVSTVSDYDIALSSVSYITSPSNCNNILATDVFNISFEEASIDITEGTVDDCGPDYMAGFTVNMTYPAINNMDLDILTNSLITSDVELPVNTVIDWDYNSVVSGSYTLTTATDEIYLSTIVGSQASLQGHSGTDVWLIDVTVPGQASYVITVEPVAQLDGVDYFYGGSDAVTLNYYTSPVAQAGPGGATCLSSAFTLAAVPSIGTGTWSLFDVSSGGLAVFASPNSPTSTVTVDISGIYTFRWTEENGTCSSYDDVVVEYYPLPTPAISGASSVCAGSAGITYSTPTVSGNAYLWNVTGGTIVSGQGTTSIMVDWGYSGTTGIVSVTEYMAVTFCSQTTDYNVNLIALPDPVISGTTSVVTGSSEVYSTTNTLGHAYTWTVTGGSITSGQNTSSITVLWQASPGSGTVTVTELNLTTGCIGTSDPLNVTITTGGVKVSGNFVYYNGPGTPLVGLSLTLMNGTTPAGTTTTDASGYYEFSNVADGTYTIDVSTTLAPDGMNSLDAGKVNVWWTGPTGIERVKWNSGDVNNVGGINSTDAGNIQKYFALGEPFVRGDWTFWMQGAVSSNNPPTSVNTFTVSGSNVSQNYYGLCVGDFNGSYIPPTTSMGPVSSDMLLTYDGTVIAGQLMQFDLPIKVTSAMKVAALSLILEVPSDLVSIEGVMINNGDLPAGTLDYGIVGNELRIGWNTQNAIDYTSGNILLTLQLRTTENFTSNDQIQIALVPNSLNEIGDKDYNAIEDVVLSTSIVAFSPTGLGETDLKEGVSIESYPNPFNAFTHLNYSIPVDCEVKLEVYNNSGTLLKTLVDGPQKHGEYTVKYNALNINAGVYTVILRVKADDQEVVRTIKLVNNSN